MGQPITATEVDTFLDSVLLDDDDRAMAAALRASDAAGLPQIAVSPQQGKLLSLLARAIGAQRILEVGTLGGYSTIWLARGLAPGGKVVTLEYSPKHAEVATANVAAAGLAERVEVRVGAALDTLPNVSGPFDLVFIDADKENNANYVEWAVRLSRPGALIVVDNVIRDGLIVTPGDDAEAHGARHSLEEMGKNPRLDAVGIQTVGVKGWDGFALAVVK